MNLSTYRRARELARRGFHGPKQRRAERIHRATFAPTPTLRKRAYRSAQRRGRRLGLFFAFGAAVLLGIGRRTAP